jgi:hypothetical protein
VQAVKSRLVRVGLFLICIAFVVSGCSAPQSKNLIRKSSTEVNESVVYRNLLLVFLWPTGRGFSTALRVAQHDLTIWEEFSDAELADDEEFRRHLFSTSEDPLRDDSSITSQIYSVYLIRGEERFRNVSKDALRRVVDADRAEYSTSLDELLVVFNEFTRKSTEALLVGPLPAPTHEDVFGSLPIGDSITVTTAK